MPEDGGAPFLSTLCDSCGLEVRDWGRYPNEAVFDVHRRERPHCEFVVGFSSLLKTSRDVRMSTFFDWPAEANCVSPGRLADCGLYYLHIDDRVRCAFCMGDLRNWGVGDDPLAEHARHYPCCPFVLNPAKWTHLTWTSCDCGEHHTSGRCNRASSPPPKPTDISGHVQFKPPRFPQMAMADARAKTFADYTGRDVNPVDTTKLVEAGFFARDTPAMIRCFQCGLLLGGWQPGDDPWFEHARWNPECSFVILNNGAQFVRECMAAQRVKCQSLATSTAALWETLEPFEMDQLRKLRRSPEIVGMLNAAKLPEDAMDFALLRYIKAKRTEGKSVDEDTQWSHILDEFARGLRLSPPRESRSTAAVHDPSGNAPPPEEQQASPPEEPPPPFPPGGGEGGEGKEEENPPRKATVEEQKATGGISPVGEINDLSTKCKLCYHNELCVVFMPCGHLVSCAQCSPACAQCPVCRSKIESTIRVFLQ